MLEREPDPQVLVLRGLETRDVAPDATQGRGPEERLSLEATPSPEGLAPWLALEGPAGSRRARSQQYMPADAGAPEDENGGAVPVTSSVCSAIQPVSQHEAGAC